MEKLYYRGEMVWQLDQRPTDGLMQAGAWSARTRRANGGFRIAVHPPAAEGR